MIYQVLHAGISVGNMDEALEWYQKNLDFELVRDNYMPPLGARVCFVKNGDFQLELFQHDRPNPIPEERLTPNSDLQTIGTKHVAFAVPDMKAQKAKFLANGVDIAHEVSMGGMSIMFVRDNSGVLIELIERK